MKEVLIIKTNCTLKRERAVQIRENIVEQVKQGVVILPNWLEAELINVPDDVEVWIDYKVEPPTGYLPQPWR